MASWNEGGGWYRDDHGTVTRLPDGRLEIDGVRGTYRYRGILVPDGRTSDGGTCYRGDLEWHDDGESGRARLLGVEIISRGRATLCAVYLHDYWRGEKSGVARFRCTITEARVPTPPPNGGELAFNATA
jgi:hypothetical protein